VIPAVVDRSAANMNQEDSEREVIVIGEWLTAWAQPVALRLAIYD